jgi:hypothetical protein
MTRDVELATAITELSPMRYRPLDEVRFAMSWLAIRPGC